MIALLEEEYNSTSQKYILHLTMGVNDTVADLPSSTKPFNASNYSCFFDYGEPAEESTAVNEITGKLYTYSNGEWVEPQPASQAKIPAYLSTAIKVNGDTKSGPFIALNPDDVLTPADGAEKFLISYHYKLVEGGAVLVEGDEYTTYTVESDDFYFDIEEP